MTMKEIPLDKLDKVTGGDAPAEPPPDFRPGSSWLGLWKKYQVRPLQLLR